MIAAVLIPAAAVLLAVFGAASIPMSYQMAFDRETNRVVESVLERAAYEPLELVSVRTSSAGPSVLVQEQTDTIVVSRPLGTTYPRFASDIQTELGDTDGAVSVEVHYYDRQRAPRM